MLKFLRKYNKITLVVFGSLLMVVFLLPQAIQQFGRNQQNRTVAEIRTAGEKISIMEQVESSNEKAVLSRLAVGPMGPLGLNLLNSDANHWLLLSHEAINAGLVGNESDGFLFLDSVATLNARTQAVGNLTQFGLTFDQARQFINQPQYQAQVQQMKQEMLPQLQTMRGSIGGSQRLTIRQTDEALAKLSGVYRMLSLHNFAAAPSEQRLRAYARDLDNAAIADMLFIPPEAADAIAEPTEPTEAEIAAQFERYKDVEPGTPDAQNGDAENPGFGFGYRQPDRVKLAWLTLPRSIFEEAVTIDPIEVRRRYLERQEAFVPAGPDDVFPSAADLNDTIVTELTNEQADRLMDEADRVVRSLILQELFQLGKTEADEFYPLPADWTPPSFADIARAVAEELNEAEGLNLEPLPSNVRDETWLTSNDLAQLPGLGNATVALGARSIEFRMAPLRVRELGESLPIFPIQVGVPAFEFPVTTPRGDRFYFTVLDARKASAPESIEEVREQVVEDIRLSERYQTLLDWNSELSAVLVTRGIEELETVVLDRLSAVPGLLAQTQLSIAQGVQVSRRSASQGRVQALRVQRVRDAIMAKAETLDPTVDPLTLLDAQTWLMLEVPELGGLLAVRIRAFAPLTAERYQQLAQQYIIEFTQREFSEALGSAGNLNPFTPENMVKRLDYVRVGRDAELDAAEAAAVAQEAAESEPASTTEQ